MNSLFDFIINYWLEFLFVLISGALTAFVKVLYKRVKALMVGTQALLRAELIRSGEKYLEQGWIPIYAKDAFDKTYISYHNLGGNGTMTEMHEQVMNLPIKDFSKKG